MSNNFSVYRKKDFLHFTRNEKKFFFRFLILIYFRLFLSHSRLNKLKKEKKFEGRISTLNNIFKKDKVVIL